MVDSREGAEWFWDLNDEGKPESKKPIVEITEIPIGGPPDWKDVLWSAGILEQTLRSEPLNSKLFSEDRIQEILSEYSEE